MATRIRTLNFLPDVFKTNTNAQFLSATLDQLVQQPETRKVEGYIGSKFGYGINANDYYVVEPTKIRTDYQLDPGVVFTKTNQNTAQDFISYPGILDALKIEGGLVQDNNRLFSSQFYSWDSFTNLDKLINFNQYYWIPQGPENVVVSSETVFSANDYIVTPLPNGYNVVPVTAGAGEGSTNPTLTLLRGGTYTFAVNQDSQFWIQGAPGVTGYSPTQPNLQTREIYGVDNNGASVGVVTFTVPPKDAQNEYNFPGNNLVDVVSTIPFSELNGKLPGDVSIDGITSLEGLTVMFYNTGIPAEVGYVSNFFDYTSYDTNNGLVGPQTVTVTATTGTTNLVTCSSTANLTVGGTVIFNGAPFGGLSAYSETLPSTIYYVTSILNSTQFTVSASQPDIAIAPNLEVGEQYIITSLGTTDFLQCGAASNLVGIMFTATANGLGTGTARKLTSGQQFRVGETYTITSLGTTNFTTFGAASNTVGLSFVATGAGVVTAGSFVPGLTYQITSLGTTNWNTVAGTTGESYKVGDIIVASVIGSGTGQARQLTTGSGTGTAYIGATNSVLSTATGSMTLTYNLGLYEEGYYTNVNENFYTITYVGGPATPVIRLIPAGAIPINEKITAVYGTQWISRNFYRNSFGFINLIPYLSASLDTLYYQDGTYANRVGIIRLIESNKTNTLNIETDILGQLQFTSTNGVVFTNGLKVTFQGDVFPTSYLSGEYYVEGVGTGIELLPVEDFIAPENFTASTYDPWDVLPWDSTAWEGNSYIPVIPDYITIARNSIDKNAWSRSNRWFHIDVINATATYNNNPNLVTAYATIENKAKRPIIEFYPNLKMFNSGVVGKVPVDFIDTRTTDAFSYVAGQQNYYPDIEVYTGYTATITSTNYTPIRNIQTGNSSTGVFTTSSGYNTTGFNVNDLIVFDDITPGSGFTPGGSYYVAEIVSSTEFKLASTKNGPVLIPTVSITGPYEFRWSPQSTTITIPANSITGTFTVGQYITDSTNVIPRNAQITEITGTTTLTLTLDWDEGSNYFSSQINSSIVASDTTVDNYALFNGSKIVFTADTDDNVKNKIFVSRFSQIGSSSVPVITLTPLEDGLCLPDNQTVALRGYYNGSKEFWFNGIDWIEAQQKTDINQPPLFDVYDENNISFGDASVYVGTSFTGCKLFSYGIGSGLDDSILGFPIRYSSVDNVGDISFDISLNADTFDYVQGSNPITQKVNTGYVFQHRSLTEKTRQIGWQTAVSPSVQYQIFQFKFDPLSPSVTFNCDISKLDGSETSWPTIQVFLNNHLLSATEYSYTVGPTNTIVTLNFVPESETVIQVLLLSNQVSKTAYYSIPINLNNNPFNEDVVVANVGDIRGQYQSIFYNNPNITGEVFGPNNFRDLGNLVPWGTKIIQNSASLVLPGTFLRKQDHNLFNALLFNNREYVKFKNLLMYTIQNSEYEQRYNPSLMLDDALDQITASKTENQPFFWSDMIPNKASYVTNTYSFANSLDVSIYPLTKIYDFSKANYNGVLVYLTRTVNNIVTTTQLVKDRDYTVSSISPSLTVTLDLQINDTITIKEYTQTYGSYVPNTPTKLGLYPSHIPQVILDSNYSQPTYFIKGHDGSYTKLYGDYDPVTGLLIDFRDQVLLEFELRIYNNLKLSSVIPIQEYEIVPGFFRDTDYSYDEWLTMYSQNFLNWIGQNRLNYKTQLYNFADEYTYNYSQSGNSINKKPISQGYWRGIYQYFYDTTTPESTPWEMLGLTSMPDWWTNRYGPAPYTSENLILWTDLQNGVNWNNGNPYVVEQAIRPGLLDIIPVDSAGDLLPPLSALIGSYNERLFQREWKIGDSAPVEFSYRRSSSYPFDLVKLMALMKPSQFYNLAVDLDNYKYNAEFDQYLVNNRSHLVIKDVEIYGNGTAKTSYINWIVDYEKQIGIDATANITTLLDNLDVRLVYRLSGFSDKSLLKFYVEKGTPNSRNASLLIPDESYSVLLYDNQPFNKIVYSGVIIQRNSANAYTVYGNSQNTAYFTTLKPKFSGEYRTFTIDDASVTITPEHFDDIVIVPYGTTLYSYQEVAQFLSNYGAWLTTLGMQFEQMQNELTINWDQMISEFLYWAQNDWESGSTITLNPAAETLRIEKDSNIVQPLTIQQSNFVLNQNLYPIPINDLAINRLGVAFTISTLNQGDSISYGQFNLSNFEHGIVFDNVTVFKDVIYNLVTGLRQTRISLRGTKSAAWDGTVNAAGFIYNQDNIKEWSKLVKYTKGEIVKYKNKYWIATKIIQPSEIFKEDDWKRTDYDEVQKGLLPNPSTRSYESSLYYDIDKANLELDADQSSFSLIGYRPRDYMALADLTDITQINVYKNMIRSKGTRDSTYAFKGANLPQGGINYDIYENWAIKSGEFGGVLNNNFIEFKVNEKYMTGNPSIVGLTNGVHNEGVQQEIPLYSLFNYGRPVTSVNVLPTVSSDKPSTVYPDAGYVNFNDVKMSAFFYSQMPVAVNKNSLVVPVDQFYVRDYAWVANFKERWEVFTPSSMGQVISALNNLNETVTITFNQPHNLELYDPFVVVNFDDQVNGYYIAAAIIDAYRVIINKVVDTSIKVITGLGIGLRLSTQRVSTPSQIAFLPLMNSEFRKNTVWVDTNIDGSWGVYRKSINYKQDQQITKTLSESLGSAVAIGNQLGYLIGDSDDGKVYRYLYNELAEQYQLNQTLTGVATFGSTIEYAGDLYAIAATSGSGYIRIYQLQNTTISDDLVLIQTISTTGASFGSSMAMSGDQKWLYVAKPDDNTVEIYKQRNLPTQAGYFTSTKTYRITEVGTTDFTALGATSNDVGVCFVATGAGTGTGTATEITYEYVTVIDGDALGFTTAGDNFGKSISTDYYGDCVVISAPNKDFGTISNWGYAYNFDRVRQNIEVQNSTSAQIFNLAWTPVSLQKTVSSTTAPNTVTLNNTTGITVNDPIVFTTTGTGLSGTLIESNKVYYVNSIVGSNITIKESRTSAAPFVVTTNPSVTSTLHVQNDFIYVYNNGSIIEDSNYAVINDTLLYTGPLLAGDIITVDGNQFTWVQTLTTQENPQIGSQFGTSVDTNTFASEILVGAPFQLNSQFEEGSVYRYTDGGAKFGTITGTSECEVTVSRKLLINGFLVYIPAGNAQVVANAIESANITNVTASASNNILTISLIDTTLATVNEKLVLSAVDTQTLGELGITVFTQTQEILCPHRQGPTQFGTTIKFNEFDSFIASAPVGTRYAPTTFDFTDDENQDNDTIFDNNATQWVDSTPNFGAVYMFDYAQQYNESLDNIGRFVYAQSVNSPNFSYSASNTYDQDTDITTSNQPRYGTALDFNNYGVIVGTPNDIGSTSGTTYAGSVTTYTNAVGIKDWSLYRYSAPVVDINRMFNTLIFSAETNQTLINLDYIDPLQGKILGAARENIDIISNTDPATYNNGEIKPTSLVWGSAQLGKVWLDTTNMRYVNYHQNDDVVYNSQYWGTLFPGSDVAVYSWISSPVIPADYPGPGIPYEIDSYSIQFTISSTGALVPVYYFWVRNTNTIFIDNGKTLADSIVASYIENPQTTGIPYISPLLPNVYGLYNSIDYINANDSVLHIGYATGTNDDVAHEQYNLIRDGYAEDFLPGVPLSSNLGPEDLYDRLLDSLCGVDETGAVVPNPYLPHLVQTGVMARPRQSFFYNRFDALKNYLQYANSIISQYPITEIRQNLSFLFEKNPVIYETVVAGNCQAGTEYTIVEVGLVDWTQIGASSNTVGEVFIATGSASGEYRNTGTASFMAFNEGEKYDTANYWEYINWWAPGYDNNTKSKLQVPLYADLSTLTVVPGTIVTVATNDSGRSETYVLEDSGIWKRIGLENGTIAFKNSLWDYASVRLGYGDNFFDTNLYDEYPSEETRYITRALNEQIYTEDLLIYRNKSLILLFEYIQSETSENQNYLPWLNKTSFIDVSHTIRELRPIEVFQTDNQDFLAGYLNEVKPYHVVIKEFLFKYTGEEIFAGNITDFDLPSKFDNSIRQFVTPQLVNENPSGPYQFLPTDSIWENPEYTQWFEYKGVAITGEPDVQITTLASYISLNVQSFAVDNASGLPINGVLKIGSEKIGYANVDRALNVVSGLTRGVDGTNIETHNPGELIYIDLPAVLVLDSGRGYVEPPKVTAYIDTSIYPPPARAAVLKAVMNLDSVLRIDVEDPGQGYMVLPEIIIDPATVITFSSSDVILSSNTIRLYAPLLQTGDLVQYKLGPNDQPIGGLLPDQWYYVNVLETVPSVIIGLYANYANAINNHNRIRLYSAGTGTTQTFNLGAKASAISSATPVRENNIVLRFDRTSYTSRVIEWIAGRYYGAYYAGSYYNSEAVASSSITLQSTQPPINSILASAQGVAFEIVDLRNDRIVTYSSFLRSVESTQSSDNSVRLILQDDGSGNPNASGGTNGFYIGMPVKFTGAVGSSGLVSTTQVYYVNSILNQTDFTVSLDPSGSPVVPLSNHTISSAGLTCEVGEVTDTAVVTVNYPGILNVTNTQESTNYLTVPLNSTGTGGTTNFYINLPVFFTGEVFGGVTENRTYYVTTVVDQERFTISENQNPKTYNVLSTAAGTNTVSIDGDTSQLDINEPVIFNTMQIAGSAVDNFGGLISGDTYYVCTINSPSTFTVSTSVNGAVYTLTTVAASSTTSTLMTSQADTLSLSTASGSMTMNVSLPVSPGQVNGQLFTLYETSGQIPNVSGIDSNLITRGVAALIGQRTIDATPVNVYRIALDNFIPGINVALGLTNIYVNMPIEISQTLGSSFLQTGTTYYVAEKGTIEIEVTSTSSTGNLLTCDTTESLFEDMPIIFSGSGIGGVEIDVEYVVKRVVDDHRFTITNTPGGIEITVMNASGLMTGTGLPYIRVTTDPPGTPSPTIVDPGDTQQTATISIASPALITVAEAPATGTKIIFRTSGSLPSGMSANTTYYVTNLSPTTFRIALTPTGSFINTSGTQSGVHTMIVTTDTDINQTPLSTPSFDVSYILGGYRVIILDAASGYAIDNTITISGVDAGGTSPLNDLTLTVNSIGSEGEITGVICNGIVPGESNQYYFKVVSPNEFALFANQLMTVPVSGLSLPYTGITSTNVTGISSTNDSFTIADTSIFSVNDAIVFTGNLPNILTDAPPSGSGLILGQTYYIYQIISGTQFSVCSIPGDVSSLIQIVTTIAVDITVTKSGSFALLPEPFVFNQSIVKYNNRVYVCIISNNDTEFVFGKWQLLDSGDRRLNAMDRVYGYYQPTDNMPGKDLTQLFTGVTYPNSTYLGNPFAPSQQFELDTILQDQPFYPTEVDVTSVVWDGTNYFASANMPTYTSILSSEDNSEWTIRTLANTPLSATDILYQNGIYIITTNNAATPIFRSQDGIVWTTNGYYTPYSAIPYDETHYDMTALDVASLSLNSVAYGANIWVAVGQNIVSSVDTYIWRERLSFTNPLLSNEWFGVDYVTLPYYTGFVAVGKGQELDYSTGVGTAIDVDLIAISNDGITWNLLPSFSTQGLYAISDDGVHILAVGENGVIYSSVDGTNWEGINRTGVVSVNGSTDVISVVNTTGLAVNTPIRFNNSFDVVVAGTTYYVQSIPTSTQIKITNSIGNPAINLTGSGTIPIKTEVFIYPTTSALRDIHYANNKFIAVGDNGLLRQSVDSGTTWTTLTSGTVENLNGITFNTDTNIWIAVGDNNTIIISNDNGISWTGSALFAPQSTTYDVQGAEFTYGYGPEELVPGVVTDNVVMLVATRPGTNWDETIYQHVGYNVASIELTPESSTQTVYSFDVGSLYDIQNAAQIALYIVDGATNLGTAIYNNIDYTINWIDFTITLSTPLTYIPIPNKLRIDIYEVGNGNQLVKASTKTDPIRINDSTGWNEIYVNCNYTGQIYQGSGVIRPGTSPNSSVASETDSISNSILCDDVSGFILNEPITFQGSTFGGILEDTVYYVKSISYVTKRITVSDTFNVSTGTAGPTLPLSSATGLMTAVIQIGTGAVWTDPIMYHNGSKLILGHNGTVTRTKSSSNSIVCNTTTALILGDPIVFSATMFGNDIQSGNVEAGDFIVGQTYKIVSAGSTNFTTLGASNNNKGTVFIATGVGTGTGIATPIYYVKSIVDGNEFTISRTSGGAVLTLSDNTGGAEYMTNDYSFGIAPNGISAAIRFSVGYYDNTVDYITYTLFGETTPTQYGYTIPETEIYTYTGGAATFNMLNYNGDANPTNAVVEVNGLRLDSSDYTINDNLDTLTITSPLISGDIVAVTTYNLTDRQYFNTQYGITGKTVSRIIDISNEISPYSATTNVTSTDAGTDELVCVSTSGMSPGQTVIFRAASGIANIAIDGTVYYIHSITSGTRFKISSTPGGGVFNITSSAAGLMVAYVGGQLAVRVTTATAHGFTSPTNNNDLVRIDGLSGADQLNNNTYYVHVINSTQVDLYNTPYDASYSAVNDPVTAVSSYISGGYIWENNSFVLVTTAVTQTETDPILGNRLTVADTSMLVPGTPIIFTGSSLGGVTLNTTYYIKEVISATKFTISATRDGSEVVLTNAVGSMNATQWEQDNVNRLWVTVNGYRVPSSALRLNPNNELNILTPIVSSDTVIITSMMPSATPNEEVYLMTVNQQGSGSAYRANTQTRSWLTHPLSFEDTVIYVDDVSRLTDTIIQTSTVPAPVDGSYNVGLNADKRSICSVTVYNNTTGLTVPSSAYELTIESTAPELKFISGVSTGNTLTITITEGKLIYVDGELIGFTQVDSINNTITGIQRGVNGTGIHDYLSKYTELYGVLSNNQLSTADYSETWNSYVYNETIGDPLQISRTEPAIFLRGDVN